MDMPVFENLSAVASVILRGQLLCLSVKYDAAETRWHLARNSRVRLGGRTGPDMVLLDNKGIE